MRTCLAAGALAVAGLLAAGCSSGPNTGTGTPVAANIAGASDGGGNSKIVILANYANCMRGHGVPNFPEPPAAPSGGATPAVHSGSGVNRNTPQYRRAAQTCSSLLPRSAGAELITAQDQVDYLRAVQCMRTHGVPAFPDPVFTGGGVHFPRPPAGLDIHSPQVLRAEAICRRLIPHGLPYSR
jgi:hypothetical protein